MLTLLLAVTLAADPPGKIAQLANVDELREKLGIAHVIGNGERLAPVKVAVLDFGFDGIDPKRPCLPATAELVEHYDVEWVKRNSLGDPAFQKGFEPGNPHGRLMAQTIWALTGSRVEGPKFYLLNANGPTLFKRAVRYAIEQQVHVILFSGHFEGGGNYDGKGSINVAVSEAVRAGITWVNAAGNHHGRVYNGPVTSTVEGDVKFGSSGSSTALFFTNKLDENNLTITLTWNDYSDREDAGTIKDLDLIVESNDGSPIAKSELKQIAGDRTAGDNESRNPRERVIIPNMAKGTYRIRIVDQSRNFTKADRLRILLMPSRAEPFPHPDTNRLISPVVLTDASEKGELFPPADHPRVITVGETSPDSAAGPTADNRLKPDVVLLAVPAKWSNGEINGGTSYAAAYFAAIVVQKKADEPATTVDDWMRWFAQLRKSYVVQNNPSQQPLAMTPKAGPASWKMPSAIEWAQVKRIAK